MDKKLLTPGPLTTSMTTKEAMLHDWGSRDQKFIDLNHSIRESLVKLIDGENNYQCVPMQGSGTFAVESMVGSLTSKDAKILILINGAYGHRMKKMCDYVGRECIAYEVAEHEQHDLDEIEISDTSDFFIYKQFPLPDIDTNFMFINEGGMSPQLNLFLTRDSTKLNHVLDSISNLTQINN